MQKNYKLGLKLWSTNTDFYYKEAQKLFNQGVFDYIELYIVPNTIATIDKWNKLNIPFILHAPHYIHNVNLANKSLFESNKKIFEQVEIFRQELKSQYTIIHAGTMGNVNETIRQLKKINPKNFLIENKPFHPPHYIDRNCRGATFEEIQFILQTTECDFCLDISHAICSANSLKIEPYTFIKTLNFLSPTMYHLCDGIIDSSDDQHLNIGKGNYSMPKILSIIDKNKFISLETNKNSQENLNDFIADVEQLNEI